MLNTLFQLATDLETHGVLEKPRDKNQTKINGRTVLWIGFKKSGQAEVSLQENSGNVLKIQVNNQSSWPGLSGCIEVPKEPSGPKKKASAEESFKATRDYLNSFPAEDILEQIQKITEDIAKRSQRSLKFLPKDSQLYKSAERVTSILENDDAKAKLTSQIHKALFEHLDQIQDSKAGKNFIEQLFKIGKSPAKKLPILVGQENEANSILGGRLVTGTLELMSKNDQVGSSDPTLFGKDTERPVLSGYPLVESSYYPVSRTADFVALHGYFGKGYAPISITGMEKIRAALDYLTAPEKEGILFKRISVDDKQYLVIACPKIPQNQDLSKKLLQGIYQNNFEKLSEDEKLQRTMDFEEAAHAALNPEEEPMENPENSTEITLLVLQKTMTANLQVALDVRHRFQDWNRIFMEWRMDQLLPEGWKPIYGISLSNATGVLKTVEGLRSKFSLSQDKLQSEVDKRTPESKGIYFQSLLQPKDQIPLAQLTRIQRTLLDQIGVITLATLVAKKIKEPSGKESTAGFDFNRAIGLLILTTNRIHQTMSEKTITETTSFLIGQCIQELNRMEQGYRNVKEIKRGQKQTAAPANMRGNRIVATAIRPDLMRTISLLNKEAEVYLREADFIIRTKTALPEENRKWLPSESRLYSAAKNFRLHLDSIKERPEELFRGFKTAAEIQQHSALVQLGLNARKPRPQNQTATEKPAEK